MSSARRSMSSQSAESKRKTAGKLSKLAMVAASSEAGAATPAASAVTPSFAIPTGTRNAWSWAEQDDTREARFPSNSTAAPRADGELGLLVRAFINARDVSAQFASIHALVAAIESALGQKKEKAGKGKSKSAPAQEVAAPAVDASSTPVVESISYAMRESLFRGIFDLLTLKLQPSARAPILRALELLDAPVRDDAGVAGSVSLLESCLSSMVSRMVRTPSIALVVLFEQVLPWRPAASFLAARTADLLPAATACLEEIIVKRFQVASDSNGPESSPEPEEEEDEEESQTASAGSALWMSPSEQTRFLLRAVVTYVLRHRKEVQVLFDRFQSSGSQEVGSDARTQCDHLRNFTQTIGRIMQHASVHRDVLTQCGLVLTVLLQVSVGAGENASLDAASRDRILARAIFALFFAAPATAIDAELMRRVAALAWLHTIDASEASDAAILARTFDSRMQVLSRLAFVRSVAAHAPLSALLESGVDAGARVVSPEETLLLGHFFPAVLATCRAVNPHLRAYALQALEVLLTRCTSRITAAGPLGADAQTDALVSAMESRIASLLDLLHANWAHQFKSIPGIVKGIFIAYIDTRNRLLARDAADKDEATKVAQREEYWSRFVGQMLRREGGAADASSDSAASGGFNTSSRGVFTMLLVLLPHISVSSLLRVNPGLLGALFQAAKFRPMFGVTNQLVEMLLQRAQQEMCVATRKYVGDAAEEESATDNDGTVKRSKQKRKKDEVKQRLKAKALEAGVGTANADSAAAPVTAAPRELSPEYRAQLVAWRALWTPHVVAALLSPHAMYRSDIAACTLSHLLKNLDAHDDALESVLSAVQRVESNEVASASPEHDLMLRRARAVITVLKTARRIGLVTSRDLDTRIRNDDATGADAADANALLDASRLLPVTSSSLLAAMLHADLALRLESFEFVCHNLSSTEAISSLELRLLRSALPYLLKIGAPNVRAKFVHSVQRFALRVRDSVNRDLREEAIVRAAATATAGSAVLANSEADRAEFSEYPHLFDLVSLRVFRRIVPGLRFFAWLEAFLFDSLYPSAPFERTCGVLELYRVLLDGFVPEASVGVASAAPGFNAKALVHATAVAELAHWRVRERVFTAPKTRVLLSLLASNWERVRVVACELLERFPTPLPGFEGEVKEDGEAPLAPLLRWAITLCRSARMRDAEGGALAMRLIVKKYVIGLRWQIDYEAIVRSCSAGSAATLGTPVIAETSQDAVLFFLRSLLRTLRGQNARIASLPLATRYADADGRVHGVLLTFRLVLGDVPWTYWDASASLAAAWRTFAEEMVSELRDVGHLGLALHTSTIASAALRDEASARSAAAAETVRTDCRGHPILPPGSSDLALAGEDFADQAGEQMVVVSGWLAVKEVSLSLGAWVSTAPLPTASKPSGGLLSATLLRRIGGLLMEVLAHSKHNGVLENAHAGFLAVCSTLLASGDALQVGIVDAWLAELMGLIARPWENDMWIRRSRGVAYCLLAMLQAEPTAEKQPANDAETSEDAPTATSEETTSTRAGSLLARCMRQLMRMSRTDTNALGADGEAPRADLWKLKVHGLNILRAIFRDSLLAVDALPYVAPALATAIEGFAHANWNVRNSSLITFGALLSKAVRAQIRSNVSSAAVTESNDDAAASSASGASLSMVGSKSGMTAVDFFNHFPSLHSFLLDQLRLATAGAAAANLTQEQQEVALQQQDGNPANAGSPVDWGSDMHPSLYPILLLLSRLVPSHADAETDGAAAATTHLDMHAFLPFIRHCSGHPYYMARWMSAKAVVSLVPVAQLASFIGRLVDELPSPPSVSGASTVSHNRAHGLLLQVHTLLRFHHDEASLLSAAEKGVVARAVLDKLLVRDDRAWIGTRAMRCALVRLLFLQVVETCAEYLECAGSAAPERKRLVMLCAAACDAPAPGSFEGVARDVLRANAAAMLLRSVCCLAPAEIGPRVDLTGLVIAISSGARSLAVEEALLFTLRRCFDLHPRRMAAHLDLRRVARHLLEDKLVRHVNDFARTSLSNYTIQETSLEFLLAYEAHRREIQAEVNSTDSEYSLARHWSSILTYTVESVDVSVKCAAFACLSVCLDAEFDALTSASGEEPLRTYLAHATTWLELLQAYMDDEQPVALRFACVRAMRASGLLHKRVQTSKLALADGVVVPRVLPPPAFSSTSPLASREHAHASVRSVCVTLWTSGVVHLLQDENETVREEASAIVGAIVDQTDSAADAAEPAAISGRTLVSRVLEQAFACASSRFWSEPLLARDLSRIVRFYATNFESVFDNAASTKSAAVVSASPVDGGDDAISPSPSSSPAAATPFKLFEHEKANTVIEEVLLMELASHYLAEVRTRRLASSEEVDGRRALRGEVVDDLESWSASVLRCLADLSAQASSGTGAGAWVGGASFMEEAFVRLYGHLFGLGSALRVASTSEFRDGALADDATASRISAAIASLQGARLTQQNSTIHPLLQNALDRVQLLVDDVAAASPSTRILPAVGFLTHLSH